MAFHRALIVVPTYNEGENIERAISEFLEPIPDSELLVVDDSSPDGTSQIVARIAEENPRVHLLTRSGKLGLGSAYVAGFGWALERGYDYIIQMDADLSHDPRYLPELLECARSRADIAVGSRYISGGGTRNWGLGRKAISRAGGIYARQVLGLDVHDPTSGYACFRRSALQAIDLDTIESNGYAFQIEMKYRARRAGQTIEEVPIVFEDRRVGQSKMSAEIAFEAMWRVWQLRLRG